MQIRKNITGIKMEPLEIVNKYLSIIFKENKKGEGLGDVLAENFIFDDPFTTARSSNEFISKSKVWIETNKSLQMEKQFVDGNSVFCRYVICINNFEGKPVSFQLADYFEIERDRIVKERVFFFDQVGFAKEMGFINEYLKKYL